MIRYIGVLFFLLLTGCATQQTSTYASNKYIEFVNNNKMGMKLDFETIRDKDFRLKIPKGMQSTNVSVGGCFLHTLNFVDNQKIILLYLPVKESSIDKQSFNLPYQSFNLSYKDFESLCEKAKISEYIEEIDKLRNRRFGMNKLNASGFYVFYLNIKRSEVNTFNYSINSVQL